MTAKAKKHKSLIFWFTLVLVAINIIFLFLPILEFSGTVEMGGKVVETLTVKASFFDILNESEVEVASSLSDEFTKAISIKSLWDSSEQYMSTYYVIGFGLFFGVMALSFIALLSFTFAPNRVHSTVYFLTCMVLYVVAYLSCMEFIPNEGLFKSFSGFSINPPIVAAVVIIAVNTIFTSMIDNQTGQFQAEAYKEFINKYQGQSNIDCEQLKDDLFTFIGNARYGFPSPMMREVQQWQK